LVAALRCGAVVAPVSDLRRLAEEAFEADEASVWQFLAAAFVFGLFLFAVLGALVLLSVAQ
jgi:hypothetical protein